MSAVNSRYPRDRADNGVGSTPITRARNSQGVSATVPGRSNQSDTTELNMQLYR